MRKLSWKLSVVWFALVGGLAAASSNPALTGDPNGFAGTVFTGGPGDNIDVHFTNPALANKTVTVIAANDDGDEIEIRIKLDKNGKGKEEFTLPDWGVLSLDHPTSESHVIVIY